MYKKIILIFSFFLLASCFGSGNKINGEDAQIVEGSGFSIKIPKTWSHSGSVDFLPGNNNVDIVLGATSNNKKQNFSDNIIIIKEKLSYIGSSVQYAEINNRTTTKRYAEYKSVKAEDFIFPDSEQGKYYVFDARYNSNMSKYRFAQTAKMCGTTVYMLNATLNLDSDTDKILNIFKTFTCK